MTTSADLRAEVLAALRALAEDGRRSVAVIDVALRLPGRSIPALAAGLDELWAAGLVERPRDGRFSLAAVRVVGDEQMELGFVTTRACVNGAVVSLRGQIGLREREGPAALTTPGARQQEEKS
jgi:hypothetical protein